MASQPTLLPSPVARALGAATIASDEDSPAIIFPLERNIRISQFPSPFPSPLISYRPAYTTLEDGSLLTSVYKADLYSANSRLFGIGALLTLGAINVWTCVSFIRRGKVKDKTLFYLLLASQLLLPVCFFALLSPFFLSNVNCTIVNTVAVIATEASYAILISGILGLKAYRCLSKSKFILVVVWVLQSAVFVLFAFDIRGIDSPRRISGSCSTDGKLKFMPIALILTVVETLFLGLCFLYAVWKSSLYPAAQGRLSIAISEKPPTIRDEDVHDPVGNPNTFAATRQRGWWDYVPRAPPSDTGSVRAAPVRTSDDSLVKRLRNSVMRLTTSMDLASGPGFPQQQAAYNRKPSIPTEYPISQPPRPQHTSRPSHVLSEKSRMSTVEDERRGALDPSRRGARNSEIAPSARTTSVKSILFAPSVAGMTDRSSKIDPLQPLPRKEGQEEAPKENEWDSKKLPTVFQLRAVIKDEMIYTFIIMLSCMLSAGLAIFRAKQNDVVFGPSVWLGANWAAISLLVMRSFSRVVRRHERDAILQSPTAYGSPSEFVTALARRRRDALALAARTESSIFAPLPGDPAESKRRKLARRSSWDHATSDTRVRHGYTQSLFEDNASLRRREGLRAWDEEKERRKLRELESENPFADFEDIAGFGYEQRKSGEGPLGVEELMLDNDSIYRRGLPLQKPMTASPWTESPFTYVGTGSNPPASYDGERRRSIGPMSSPFDPGYSLGRRLSDVSLPPPAAIAEPNERERQRYLQPSLNPSPTSPTAKASGGITTTVGFSRIGNGLAGTLPGGGVRRGAITTESVPVVAVPTRAGALTPEGTPSPPQSHHGSSIEMLEQPRTT